MRRLGVDAEVAQPLRLGRDHAVVVELRVLPDEAERHELGEAAALLLDAAQQVDVARDVARRLDVPVHDGRRGRHAQAMRGGDDLDPAPHVHLLVGEDLAHLVVEDLGCRARDAAETVVAQHADVGGVVQVGPPRAVHDLHGREGVHVDLGEARLDGDQHVPVGEGAHLGVDAALHAHFGRAAGDCLLDLAEHDVDAVGVGVVLPALALEGAELAVHEADVGEVDVAVDDVGDLVAHVRRPDRVRAAHQCHEVVALRAEEGLALVDRELAALERALEDGTHAGGGAAEHASERLVVEGDGLDHFPGLDPAHAEASTPPGAVRVSSPSAATRARSAGARKPGRST